MKLASAAYPMEWFQDWSGYEAKLRAWVSEAAGQGADLLVFPEYGAMELASLAGDAVRGTTEAALRAASDHLPAADRLHQALAQEFGVYILAASGPAFDDERPVNRARFFGPSGAVVIQDKQIMTMFERAPMDVVPGGPLVAIETALGTVGILICYDVEFPLLGRALIEAGVDILLAPSCTDSLAGYWRVRVGAMARALEGQCAVVHSPTIGTLDWCPVVDENTGAAAIYGPPDIGFPSTGVLAEGALNHPGWVIADLSREAIQEVRRAGQVRNHSHWTEQMRRIAPIKTVTLR